MEEIKLSKDKSLVNLANSILKHFKCLTYHDSIPEIDEVIKDSKKQKICLFLFDALGKYILEKYKDDAPFLYSHRYLTMYSVFPPTTVACTTSVTTGKYPIETAYLGWTQYFKDLDKYIDIFPSTYINESSPDFPSEKLGFNVQEKLLKVNTIFDDINKKYGKIVAVPIQSFNYKKCDITNEESNLLWAEAVDKSLSQNLFTYAYNVFPDSYMHEYGIDDIHVKNVIKQINDIVENLVKKHKDTLFIGISDHGMIDVKEIDINNIPGFTDTLERKLIAIEKRFSSFFVKDEKKFLEIYNSNPILKKHFMLITKDEVLNKHYFGYSENINKFALETIGNYLLIALDEYYLSDKANKIHFKGHHAGLSKQEREIYLQVYNA